jgi:hypothetical protein
VLKRKRLTSNGTLGASTVNEHNAKIVWPSVFSASERGGGMCVSPQITNVKKRSDKKIGSCFSASVCSVLIPYYH